MTPRGHLTADLFDTGQLTGAAATEMIASSDSAPKVDGNIAIWQNGCVVDSGVSLASLISLAARGTSTGYLTTDAGDVITTDAGDLIIT